MRSRQSAVPVVVADISIDRSVASLHSVNTVYRHTHTNIIESCTCTHITNADPHDHARTHAHRHARRTDMHVHINE